MASTALERAIPEATRILIISPNEELRVKVSDRLSSESCFIDQATGGAAALAQAEECGYTAVYLDRRLSDLNAEEVAALLQRRQPGARVVFIDSEDPSERAEFLEAGVSANGFEQRVSKVLLRADGPAVSRSIASSAEHAVEALPGMFSSHRAMQQVFRMARLVAPRDTTVLITGETGTGKELVANAIHQLSERRNGAFVVVNCAAIPEELLESELFGYARGAFTGATQSRLGRIHASHGGTLFLDEVGDLPLGMQAKLLRFLQHGEVQRLGSPDILSVYKLIKRSNVMSLKRMSTLPI